MFIDRRDGSYNDLFYYVLFFVLTHVFFWQFFVPGQMIFGTDIQNQSYPIQQMAVSEMLKDRSLMLWNPYIYGGMPFLASFSFPIFYPFALLFFVLPVPFAMGYEVVIHFFLMGVFMFAFLRDLKLSRHAAFIGGLLLVFNLHCISLVFPGHGGKIFTVTYLPLAMMLLDRAFRERPAFNLTMLGLLLGLMFYGGHPQILFYCGGAMSLFFLMRLVQESRRNGLIGSARLVGLYCAAFALGTLLYAAILFPAWEYRGYTHRVGGVTGATTYEFATSFSPPPEDILYLFMRNPFGWGKDYGPTIPNTKDEFYRGRMGLKLNIDYFGVFGLVLALIGVVFVRNRYTWFFAFLALLSVFLSLGRFNPYYIYVYKYVPGFSLFRVPYAILIILPMCGTTVAAFGMQYLLDSGDASRKKGLMYLIAAGSILAAAALALSIYWTKNAVDATDWALGFGWVREMLWGQFDDAVQRMLFFARNLQIFSVCLAASMSILVVYRMGLLKVRYLTAVVSVFIIIDLWPLGWDFIKTVPVSSIEGQFFRETPQIKMLEADKDGPFRVYSLVTNNELLYRGIQSLTGYHAVPLGYTERTLDSITFDNSMLDMLNAKYLMLPKDPDYDFLHYPIEPVKKKLEEKYELISDTPDMFFYRNRSVLPRAFLVKEIMRAGGVEDALGMVSDPYFKPGLVAVIAEDPDSRDSVDPSADLSGQKVRVASYAPDKIVFDVYSPADSFMVVSEVWYPGWKAYVDGREKRIYRTDYLLRGLTVPAGEHKVVMEFKPGIFRLGEAVSLLTLIFFAAVLGWPVYKKKYRGKGRQGTKPPGKAQDK